MRKLTRDEIIDQLTEYLEDLEEEVKSMHGMRDALRDLRHNGANRDSIVARAEKYRAQWKEAGVLEGMWFDPLSQGDWSSWQEAEGEGKE